MPLVYFARSDGRWMIVASNGGSCTHPAWYYNLKSHPRMTVELGTDTFHVVAEELDTEARSFVWPTIVEQSPAAGEFQIGTIVSGDLELDTDYTVILFKHQGWKEPVEFMHHCSKKWPVLLLSLKSLLETGKGSPGPRSRSTTEISCRSNGDRLAKNRCRRADGRSRRTGKWSPGRSRITEPKVTRS